MEAGHEGEVDIKHGGEENLDDTTYFEYTTDFITDTTFGSRVEAVKWVQSRRYDKGFVIITKGSDSRGDGRRRGRVKISYRGDVQRVGKWKGNRDANILMQRIVSDEHGEVLKKTTRPKCGTKKCGCPFVINIKEHEGRIWRVTLVYGRHNHDIGSHMEGHSYAGLVQSEEHEVVVQMMDGNMNCWEILDIIKKRAENMKVPNSSTMRTIYNAMQKIWFDEAGGRSQMQQLMHLLDTKDYISWHRKLEGMNVVTDLFWAHGDSIKLLRCFQWVLLFDCTYNTNRYRMPLLEIVGVTSTGLSFAVGFAIFSSKNKDNNIWTLKNVNDLMDRWSKPHVILTDRELGLIAAIEMVFPISTHLLCTWHINKGMAAKGKKNLKRNEDLNANFEDLFNMRMSDLAADYACLQGLPDYLMDTWVREYKEKFLKAWTDRTLHLRHFTTGRVESAHNALKKRLGNSLGNFEDLWRVTHSLVEGQHIAIKASFETSLNDVQHGFGHSLYHMLRGFIS